jgi:hypothetical protein
VFTIIHNYIYVVICLLYLCVLVSPKMAYLSWNMQENIKFKLANTYFSDNEFYSIVIWIISAIRTIWTQISLQLLLWQHGNVSSGLIKRQFPSRKVLSGLIKRQFPFRKVLSALIKRQFPSRKVLSGLIKRQFPSRKILSGLIERLYTSRKVLSGLIKRQFQSQNLNNEHSSF